MTTKLLLILILLLSLGLRLFRLADRPLGFTWDEAAIGYNAFSLLHSGLDEHHQVFPLVFKSFGDYKPGLFIYSTVPSIALFGLNEFSTRLPSAIAGALLVLVIFVLSRTLFNRQSAALFASLTLAISPLAIHFSRGAWEANLSLLLTTVAVTLFIRQKYFLASLFFGLTFWTYQSAKLFTPLLILILILVYKPVIKLKSAIISVLLFLLLLTPILINLSSQSGRLKVFSVFSYTRSQEAVSEILRQEGTSQPNLVYYLFNSEKLDQARGIINRYLNHFSPRFLFIEGNWSDLRQSTAPFYGNLHLPEIITLILGLVILIKFRLRNTILILAWLLLAPLPSALSRDIISSVRSLPLLIPLALISGMGLAAIATHKFWRLVYFPLLAFFLVYFLNLYFIHSPHYTGIDWLYPYKPVMELIKTHQSAFSHIVFTEKLGQPYIFALFYLYSNSSTPPPTLIREDNPQGDVGRVTSMDKFTFRPIYWPADRGLTSTLFVGDQYELPKSDLLTTSKLLKFGQINYPNGSPGLTVVGLP